MCVSIRLRLCMYAYKKPCTCILPKVLGAWLDVYSIPKLSLYVHLYICKCICIYRAPCMHRLAKLEIEAAASITRTHTHTHAHTHTHTHTHTRTHTHTHTNIHTHTHTKCATCEIWGCCGVREETLPFRCCLRADHGMGSGKFVHPGRPPDYTKGQTIGGFVLHKLYTLRFLLDKDITQSSLAHLPIYMYSKGKKAQLYDKHIA